MENYLPNKTIDELMRLIPISYTIHRIITINGTYLDWDEITRTFTGFVRVSTEKGLSDYLALWSDDENDRRFYSEEVRERDAIMQFYLPYVLQLMLEERVFEAKELVSFLWKKLHIYHFYFDDIVVQYIKEIGLQWKKDLSSSIPREFYNALKDSYIISQENLNDAAFLFFD